MIGVVWLRGRSCGLKDCRIPMRRLLSLCCVQMTGYSGWDKADVNGGNVIVYANDNSAPMYHLYVMHSEGQPQLLVSIQRLQMSVVHALHQRQWVCVADLPRSQRIHPSDVRVAHPTQVFCRLQ